MPSRAAVIGTGFIGPVHVEALRRAGVEVAGIVGSTPEKSRLAINELSLPDNLLTFEDVCNDDSVDSVHITTPNRLHFEQVKQALEAGKHVLCEKPLALTSDQSSELVKLANATDRVTGVAYNIRFYPLCHEAANLVQSGEIGEFIHVQGSYVQDWLLYPTDFNWRVLAKEGGSLRAVADIGTHWLDLIQFITGQDIVSVCADLRTVYPKRFSTSGSSQTFSNQREIPDDAQSFEIKTEDCGSVMLRFANGSNGNLWVSQTTAGRKNCLRFELAGTEASISWNSEEPNSLWRGERQRANQSLLRDPSLLSKSAQAISQYPGGHNEGFPDTFKQLFRKFYGYIEAGDFSVPAPFPTFAEGHKEMLICDAILESHQQRCWVDVK